jgi:hypothetical protein
VIYEVIYEVIYATGMSNRRTRPGHGLGLYAHTTAEEM